MINRGIDKKYIVPDIDNIVIKDFLALSLGIFPLVIIIPITNPMNKSILKKQRRKPYIP